MKRIGSRIGWVGIDLTYHTVVAVCAPEQVEIQRRCQPPTPRRRRHHDPVDIDEPSIPRPEPGEVRIIVGRVLVESQQQRVGVADARGHERPRDEIRGLVGRQEREFLRESVVEAEQRRR